MFGLNIYAIFAIVGAVLFCGGFVNGCSYQQSKAEKTVRDKEHQYQADADKIRTEKDAQIKAINNQLADTLVSLRSRTSRTAETSNGKNCNGTGLYVEDSEFLVREASRADEIRVALDSCYKQYDSLK
jgi:hypothetical protein